MLLMMLLGRQLEADKLKKDIKSKINGVLSEDVISIVAPVKEIKPKVSTAALKAINTRISSLYYELCKFSRR